MQHDQLSTGNLGVAPSTGMGDEAAPIASTDSPYGLTAFVAERHGLPLTEAEELIERWLAHYESASKATRAAAELPRV